MWMSAMGMEMEKCGNVRLGLLLRGRWRWGWQRVKGAVKVTGGCLGVNTAQHYSKCYGDTKKKKEKVK